ncbi:HAMP domain-containing histidine kinase [Streptomyces sp. NBC_01288]|uniref:sensor histidine kinase n=1 Tax=Streptomyces sp. NBC_01288 TaxID=2903814 RepID=UPI002E1360DF|nr:HAMP domain-containing histidine kinase [Streptomyces sp. NBC_01288]
MTPAGVRLLLRRLRPATIRMRLAVLAAVITFVPLTAAAIPIARTERTAQMQNADHKAARMSPVIDTMINGLSGGNPPDCTRFFQPAQQAEYKDISLCRPTKKTRASQGKLSLIPWTDPVRGPVPIRQIIYRTYVHAGVEDVAVTQSLEAEQARLNTIVRLLIGGIAGMTLVVSGTTWFAAGRVLRPVEAIRADFADLSAHHLDRRVPVPRSGNEISRLAVTMNSTLDRLQGVVEQQRQFTADASHELRTPLACLRTELELALNHPDTADWPLVVHAAHDDTLRLQALTSDLLLLARLDAGHADPPPNPPFDLTELVRGETSRRRLPPHLTLTALIHPAPIPVLGHQALLARVLGNLLDNAERHAVGTVTVRLTRDAEHGRAVLEVLDDGPGIPPEHHQRIFERFSRLDDARARDEGGAGLGLAIAERIATAHHGTLAIVPSLQGAHFLLRLPTGTPPEREPLNTATSSGPTDSGPTEARWT